MVNLRVLRDLAPVLAEQAANGVEIRRAQPNESDKITGWVNEHINRNWTVVCEVALEQKPPCCYIAIEMNQTPISIDKPFELSPENILGFACYDVVREGVFGPSGVREDQQESDISTALLLACLHAMAAEKYPYAVIGWAGTTGGYADTI